MSASASAADRAACRAIGRFAEAMAEAGGWEDRPRLAVALSGGPDSLALAMLAASWARERGGEAIALILDHGLRAASATEARLATSWAGRLGLPSLILRLPLVGTSAARLRRARHEALEQACAEQGVLHLLLGHHLADQAETVLIRALAGTGEAGLGAMAPVRYTGVRVVRPLLAIRPAELKALLRARGQGWVADPSNDAGGLRARLRHAMADRDGEGAAIAALAASAMLTRARDAARARDVADLLARAASIRYRGGVALDHVLLASAAPSLRAAVLAALCARVSGRGAPPRARRAAAAADRFATARVMTLGGCVLRRSGGRWLVAPERRVAAVAERASLLYAAGARRGTPGGAVPSMSEDAANHWTQPGAHHVLHDGPAAFRPGWRAAWRTAPAE